MEVRAAYVDWKRTIIVHPQELQPSASGLYLNMYYIICKVKADNILAKVVCCSLIDTFWLLCVWVFVLFINILAFFCWYKYIYIYILFSSLSIVIICDSKCTFWEQIKDRLQGRIRYRANTCWSLWKQTFYFSIFTSILFFNVILHFCFNLDCSKKSSILCIVKKLSEHYKSMYIIFIRNIYIYIFFVCVNYYSTDKYR